jgi:uncharacterized protein YyaL (SSP411 family)
MVFFPFLKLAVNDLFKKETVKCDTKIHLDSAMNWMLRSYEATGKKGISKGYFLFSGWKEAYPEVTGYTIPTFFKYAKLANKDEFKRAALEMADWLVSIRLRNGAFPASDLKTPIVFDTAQIIRGLISAHKQSKQRKFLISAVRAADWLVSIQEEDGSWQKNTFRNKSHSYHSLVAWALLEVHKVTGKKKYFNAAKGNLNWVLKNQNKNGWFEKCHFYIHPSLHTIAYTVEGLLLSGKYLRNKNMIFSAQKTADVLLELQKKKKLFGGYNKDWKNTTKSSCLTGIEQISIIWHQLFEITKSKKYLEAAKKATDFLKKTQLAANNQNLDGAIKGSHPIYGAYEPFRVLSWATKFFADSLMRYF